MWEMLLRIHRFRSNVLPQKEAGLVPDFLPSKINCHPNDATINIATYALIMRATGYFSIKK
jgi:hypothetical protein